MHAHRNRAVEQLITYPVRRIPLPTEAQLAVAANEGALPFPALSRFFFGRAVGLKCLSQGLVSVNHHVLSRGDTKGSLYGSTRSPIYRVLNGGPPNSSNFTPPIFVV